MDECLKQFPNGAALTIFGILSLVFWALVVVVSAKYIAFVMRADNKGEGGIFAMLGLLESARPSQGFRISPVVLMFLFGAALLYGDGLITPAISVLGAAEGLKSVNPALEPWVVPVSCLVLGGLFLVQHHGTSQIGRVFGPVMLVWFSVIGLLGAAQIAQNPEILKALNPWYALRFLFTHSGQAAHILGSVVLAITGAEALYADMGHFGRDAIRKAWCWIAFPGLALSYFGQGAYALNHQEATHKIFYEIAPEGPIRMGLLVLAFCASVIASQALITGVFSLTRQAVQLGYFPRVQILHTNARQEGQIYLPLINWLMACGCIALVLGFRSSSGLASAYGIAVTGTMGITTAALCLVALRVWNWPLWKALTLCGFFLVVDLAFFGANLTKLADGGWVPIAVAVLLFGIMHSWRSGRSIIAEKLYKNLMEEDILLEELRSGRIPRTGRAAVFMASLPRGIPIILMHHLKSSGSLHEKVIILSMLTTSEPYQHGAGRLDVTELGHGVWRVVARYGYMQTPRLPAILRYLAPRLKIKPRMVMFYFNRESVMTTGNSSLWAPQKALYALLTRMARPARDYFGIPSNQICEIGLPVAI
jgi:KUP system potassium uptake protein